MDVFEPLYGILASRLGKGYLSMPLAEAASWFALLGRRKTGTSGQRKQQVQVPLKSFNLKSRSLKALILTNACLTPRQAAEREPGTSMDVLG